MCGTDTRLTGRLSVKIHTDKVAALPYPCHLADNFITFGESLKKGFK